MNILIVNTSFSKGGAAEVARLLYKSMNEFADIDISFAYGRGEKINKEEVLLFSFKPEIYLHALITRATGLQGYGSYFSTKRLIDYISKSDFDLIHLHNIHGYYLNLKFIQKVKQFNIPVVWTLHDTWPITGSCAYFMNCHKWKRGCGNCPNKYKYPKSFVDQSSFMWQKKKKILSRGWYPTLVTPSWWLKNQIRKSFLGKLKVKVIPNAVNTELFKPRNQRKTRKMLGIPRDKKIVLFVAADLNNKRKGVRYFFESLSNIKAKDWRVVTVGKKIDFQDIENNSKIIQLGYVSDRSTMAKIYNIADLFCITALQDNLPTTINESLASGTPVVGFRVGGIPEQVNGDCGILVEKKNTQALAKGISKLLNNEELRERMSINSRKKALKEFSLSKFKRGHYDLYKQSVSFS